MRVTNQTVRFEWFISGHYLCNVPCWHKRRDGYRRDIVLVNDVSRRVKFSRFRGDFDEPLHNRYLYATTQQNKIGIAHHLFIWFCGCVYVFVCSCVGLNRSGHCEKQNEKEWIKANLLKYFRKAPLTQYRATGLAQLFANDKQNPIIRKTCQNKL